MYPKWKLYRVFDYTQRRPIVAKKRYSGQELHARLIFIVGIVLAAVFAVCVFGFVYALMFITQPIGAQSPNDAAFIDLLKTLTVFLTGSLGGLVMSNGMKSKKDSDGDGIPDDEQQTVAKKEPLKK